MDGFNVVHAAGDAGKKWQENGHGYVPQVRTIWRRLCRAGLSGRTSQRLVLTCPVIVWNLHAQTYFYDAAGNPIVDAKGPNAKYAHFFGDEVSLAGEMKKLA